jgi:hypothetical protein
VQNDWRTLKCGTHDLGQCLGLHNVPQRSGNPRPQDRLDRGAELLLRNPDGSWPSQPLSLEAGDLTFESIRFNFPLAAAYAGTRIRP